MDKIFLDLKYIEDGERLIKELDKTDFGVHSSFWNYMENINEWRLIIATKLLRQFGPKESYGRLQKIIYSMKPLLSFSLSNITVLADDNILIQVLSTVIKTKSDAINRIRMTNNNFKGIFINDILIYRMQ